MARTVGDYENQSDELEGLRSELEEMTAAAKRVQADFQNYRRRAEEAREVLRSVAQEELIGRLLPVIDNLERAAGHAEEIPAEVRDNEWVKGIVSIEAQLQSLMGELGVERIPTVGEHFDPNLHEAIGETHDTSRADGEITEELEAGWRFNERVIRPAKVRVNRRAE